MHCPAPCPTRPQGEESASCSRRAPLSPRPLPYAVFVWRLGEVVGKGQAILIQEDSTPAERNSTDSRAPRTIRKNTQPTTQCCLSFARFDWTAQQRIRCCRKI